MTCVYVGSSCSCVFVPSPTCKGETILLSATPPGLSTLLYFFFSIQQAVSAQPGRAVPSPPLLPLFRGAELRFLRITEAVEPRRSPGSGRELSEKPRRDPIVSASS